MLGFISFYWDILYIIIFYSGSPNGLMSGAGGGGNTPLFSTSSPLGSITPPGSKAPSFCSSPTPPCISSPSLQSPNSNANNNNNNPPHNGNSHNSSSNNNNPAPPLPGPFSSLVASHPLFGGNGGSGSNPMHPHHTAAPHLPPHHHGGHHQQQPPLSLASPFQQQAASLLAAAAAGQHHHLDKVREEVFDPILSSRNFRLLYVSWNW